MVVPCADCRLPRLHSILEKSPVSSVCCSEDGGGFWQVEFGGQRRALWHLSRSTLSPGAFSKASSVVFFLLAYPSWRLRSTWMGVIVHSAQSVFFTFLVLGVVFGLA